MSNTLKIIITICLLVISGVLLYLSIYVNAVSSSDMTVTSTKQFLTLASFCRDQITTDCLLTHHFTGTVSNGTLTVGETQYTLTEDQDALLGLLDGQFKFVWLVIENDGEVEYVENKEAKGLISASNQCVKGRFSYLQKTEQQLEVIAGSIDQGEAYIEFIPCSDLDGQNEYLFNDLSLNLIDQN